MTNKYAFAELADKSKDGIPQEFPIPIGLTKSKELGIRNVIIEMDLAYFDYDYGKWTEEQIWDLMRKRIEWICLLYTSPSPRDLSTSRMPSSA